jgi:hypothetical protein
VVWCGVHVVCVLVATTAWLSAKSVRAIITDDHCRLTSSGEHTAVLLDIAKNDTMGFKLIGTRGQSLTNRHEGRGGWTVADYATAGREAVFFTVTGVKNAPGGNPAVR